MPALRSASQADLVNNLNGGHACGLVPLFVAANGAGLLWSALVAAVYPGVWKSVARIALSAWSDMIGRELLIVAGMLVQATALAILALSDREMGVSSPDATTARQRCNTSMNFLVIVILPRIALGFPGRSQPA